MISSQILQVTISLVALTLTLFILGISVKFFWRSLEMYHLPIAGLLVFGGIAVPLLYLVDRYSFALIGSIVSVLAIIGIFFGVRYLKERTPIRFRWTGVGLGLLLVTVSFLLIHLVTQQPVLGGVDSAMHSIFMSFVETSGRVDVKYPLGLHTFILFLEGGLNISRVYIMQAFVVFLSINFLTLVYALLKRITGKTTIAWLGVIAAILDASFFNNYLNGSLTHILAVDLILMYLLYLSTVREKTSVTQTFLLIIFSTAIVYFHFVSWYLILPAYWFSRILYQRHKKNDFIKTLLILVLSVPLILRLYHFVGYAEIFIWSTIIIIGIEIILFFLGRYVYRILNEWWPHVALVCLAILTFLIYRNRIYYNFEQWYGWSMTVLGLLGFGYCSLKRQTQWRPYSLLLIVYTLLYTAFAWMPSLVSKISLVKELQFYYGFTVPFVLFSAMGLYFLLILGATRRIKMIKVTAVVIITVLIVTSRLSNRVFIGGKNAISRYNKNDGFGLFFQKNDVLLADWFRTHVHDQAMVANVGGLYGMWTSITGHPIAYLGYGQMNVPQPTAVNEQVIAVMTNGESGQPTTLLQNNIRYLFVPQEIPVDIVHPYLRLLRSVGSARVYSILEHPDTPHHIVTLNPLLRGAVSDVHLTGDFLVQTPLRGNRFYYQFQELVQVLTLESGKRMQLRFSAVDAKRTVNLRINTSTVHFSLTIGESIMAIRRDESNVIKASATLSAHQETVISIQNTDTRTASITNIIAEIFQ